MENKLTILLAKVESLEKRVRAVEDSVNILDTITIDHESRSEDLEEVEDDSD